jgi:hypothetical protein
MKKYRLHILPNTEEDLIFLKKMTEKAISNPLTYYVTLFKT